MPKMKTHKGLKKRIRITAKGKVRHKRPNASHLMSGKSGGRCRKMRRPAILAGIVCRRIKTVVGKA